MSTHGIPSFVWWLIGPGAPAAGVLLWGLRRRRGAEGRGPAPFRAALDWGYRLIAANLRAGYAEAQLKNALAALEAITESRDSEVRERKRLRVMLEECRSGSDSPAGPTAGATANRRTKRSPPRSGRSPGSSPEGRLRNRSA